MSLVKYFERRDLVPEGKTGKPVKSSGFFNLLEHITSEPD